MTDPIADMIIRIKNAYLARRDTVEVPFSKMKLAIAKILVEEDYAEKFEELEDGAKKQIKLTLKYINKLPSVTDVKRLSKPGRRVYSSADSLPKSLGGYGIVIISTNKGVVTDNKARQLNVGGELLCKVW